MAGPSRGRGSGTTPKKFKKEKSFEEPFTGAINRMLEMEGKMLERVGKILLAYEKNCAQIITKK